MCLVGLLHNSTSLFPIILLGNRDEFHARPTKSMHSWSDYPIFAGRDLLGGGTWLGLKKDGDFAVLTNYRKINLPEGKESRGLIIPKLLSKDTVFEPLNDLTKNLENYSGFNLLAGDKDNLYFLNDHDTTHILKLEAGAYALSNASLKSNWYKQQKLKQTLSKLRNLKSAEAIQEEGFKALEDKSKAPETQLPTTGFGEEKERFLSSSFILSKEYGTRSSVVCVFDGRTWHVREKVFNPTGRIELDIQHRL